MLVKAHLGASGWWPGLNAGAARFCRITRDGGAPVLACLAGTWAVSVVLSRGLGLRCFFGGGGLFQAAAGSAAASRRPERQTGRRRSGDERFVHGCAAAAERFCSVVVGAQVEARSRAARRSEALSPSSNTY